MNTTTISYPIFVGSIVDCPAARAIERVGTEDILRDAGYHKAFLRGKPVWVRCLQDMSVFRVWDYNQSTGALAVYLGLWKKTGKEDTQKIKVRRMT